MAYMQWRGMTFRKWEVGTRYGETGVEVEILGSNDQHWVVSLALSPGEAQYLAGALLEMVEEAEKLWEAEADHSASHQDFPHEKPF